jgi:uncharacterized protein (DUF433 family)
LTISPIASPKNLAGGTAVFAYNGSAQHTKRKMRCEMSRIQWQEHITVDPDIHHGDPCIKGTRIPVATIIGSLADGMTPEEIKETYPQLTLLNIQAALAYAADALRQDILLPFPS